MARPTHVVIPGKRPAQAAEQPVSEELASDRPAPLNRKLPTAKMAPSDATRATHEPAEDDGLITLNSSDKVGGSEASFFEKKKKKPQVQAGWEEVFDEGDRRVASTRGEMPSSPSQQATARDDIPSAQSLTHPSGMSEPEKLLSPETQQLLQGFNEYPEEALTPTAEPSESKLFNAREEASPETPTLEIDDSPWGKVQQAQSAKPEASRAVPEPETPRVQRETVAPLSAT